MADLSIKHLGIGLASSLLGGDIGDGRDRGRRETAPAGAAAGSYVYTESIRRRPAAATVLAYWVASGGSLTPVGSFATGGDGTGAGLGSQDAISVAGEGRALLVVNAGSNNGLVLPDPRRRTAPARRRRTVRRDEPG